MLPRPPDRKRHGVGRKGGGENPGPTTTTTTQGGGMAVRRCRCVPGGGGDKVVVIVPGRPERVGGAERHQVRGAAGARHRSRLGVAPGSHGGRPAPNIVQQRAVAVCTRTSQQGGAARQTWLPTTLLHQTTCGALPSTPTALSSLPRSLWEQQPRSWATPTHWQSSATAKKPLGEAEQRAAAA